MNDAMVEALLAKARMQSPAGADRQAPPTMMRGATGIGPDPNVNPFDQIPENARVTEAGVPSPKGAIAELAGRVGYDAASEINPQMLKMLAAQARPVMQKLAGQGLFAGERTTGSGMLEIAKRLKAMQSPAEGLGSKVAEYAPVGGEEIVNALRPTAAKVLSPVEKAYQRLLLQGGR